MFPLPTDDPAFFQAPPDYFQVTRPAKYASSAYDSVIALGLGSCKMQEQGFAMGKEKNRGGERFPPPLPHAASILRSSFQGASGHVSFGGDVPQARSIKGLSFGVYNIRPIMSNSGKDLHSYEAVLTSIWSEEAQRWRQIQNVVYRDGSSVAPSVLLEVLETNYLDNSVRIIGLVLFATVWLVAFGGMALVWCLRKDDLVRRGQPEFLQLLCFGSAVMGTAIFTLSWDEGAGWSDQQLDVACMLTPWFFFLGQTLGFAALFTKLWRIERVMQFTRRMVSVRHVIGPLILLMCIALLILGLWTGLDPWVWEREVIQVSPSESYGQCSSENLWAYFGPLMGVIMISEAATVFLAWKTSDIQQDLSDCHGILLAIAFQLQAWLVGVPVLAVLGNSSADATYLGRVFLIWIFSISSVLIVVWPKIYNAINLRRHPELAQTSRVRVSVYGPKSNGKRSSEMSKFNENQFCSKDAMVLSAGALDVSHGSGSGTTQKNNSFSACLPEQAKCPAGEGLEFAVES